MRFDIIFIVGKFANNTKSCVEHLLVTYFFLMEIVFWILSFELFYRKARKEDAKLRRAQGAVPPLAEVVAQGEEG